MSVYGKVTDDLQDSDPKEASFDRTNIAAMTGPKDVVEYMVRVSCDRLDEWRFGVCSLKWQNETAEITLQNIAVTTRRVKTILRNTKRNSHDSSGRCELNIKIRVLIFPHCSTSIASDRSAS